VGVVLLGVVAAVVVRTVGKGRMWARFNITPGRFLR